MKAAVESKQEPSGPAAIMPACICQKPGVEFWAHVPDILGDLYPYPLKSAKFCPLCGIRLGVAQPENSGGVRNGEPTTR
jgi:hypothetical protein